ncbi:hypothetical protein [Roseivirga sp.]|uniref:hypothetical protein n=1 Tax=Roseivirga sp. TaxID=1964215 RepID=UPI003B5257B0
MKIISEKEARLIQSNWQKLRQEHIISAFEVFDESQGEYNRITARDFGGISEEFMGALEALGKTPSDSLSLCLGIDTETEKAEVFWEFYIDGAKTYIGGDGDRFITFISPNYNPTQPRMGESVNYKNEVCANWANISYFEMNAIFFVMLQNPDEKIHGAEVFLKRPRRVLKFMIPQADIDVMKETCNTDKSLLVHYGVNYGDAARQMIPFVPLIQIYTPVVQGVGGMADEDDPNSTYLDFVGTCPPICPDGGPN